MKKCTIPALVCFLAVGVTLMLGCGTPPESTTTPPSPEPPTPTLVPQSHNLINSTIVMSPSGYFDIEFSVDTEIMHNARVVGSFTTANNSGGDIEVMIMDDMAYTDWIDGHQVSVNYTSGNKTTADIDLSITTSGKYHLVFSNNDPELSSKHLLAIAELKWDELQ